MFDPAFALFAMSITAWCVIEGTLTDEVPRGSRNLLVLASATGVAILAMFVVAIRSRGADVSSALVSGRGVRSPLWLGAIIILAGIALRCAAIYTLGDRFVSELRSDRPLIRRGVYRWMRHPSEAGLLLLTFGVCVLFGSLAAFAIWLLALVPLTITRVRIENAFLDQTCCESDSVLPSGSLDQATRSPVGAVQIPRSS